MKKSSIMMLALFGTMLVGCTQSEYIGEALQQNGNEIVFSGASGKMTRATSNTAATVAEKLAGQIKFYGVKKTDATSTYADVFQNYILWSQGGVTTSNPDGDWEYVGVNMPYGTGYGTDTQGTTGTQTIKYWDHSTDEYHFVAGSPVKAFTYALESGEIKTATVTGIAGHLNPNNSGTAISTNPIYIADPVKVVKDNYNQDVEFNFTRQQSFVRVGLFETIPGYEITAIKFYEMDKAGAWTNTSSNNITLASAIENYFTGATNATATLTYEWGTPSYEFEYSGDENEMKQQNNWFGGKLENGVPATTSTDAVYGTDGDMVATTGYFTVIPTTSELDAAPLLVKCDYELTSVDGSNEKINVTGATAAIPAAYTKWAPNTSYTYLFKISDNTNGTTGGDGDPEGLFPITFDAAVVEVVDGTAQGGTVTTVSTPSITVYQNGNVVENGITYVEGDVVVKAMVGTTEVTPTWSYVVLDGTTYDYTKDYEKLGTDGAATTWTPGALTSVIANKTYVIKAVYNDGEKDYTAYFVLVVGAAEVGPANS